ncbi:hypothetical protein CUMW_031090 [Citrus unshiu]|nr:hypothetical protein CUMW_031090 [Citrus unshiu]
MVFMVIRDRKMEGSGCWSFSTFPQRLPVRSFVLRKYVSLDTLPRSSKCYYFRREALRSSMPGCCEAEAAFGQWISIPARGRVPQLTSWAVRGVQNLQIGCSVSESLIGNFDNG